MRLKEKHKCQVCNRKLKQLKKEINLANVSLWHCKKCKESYYFFKKL